MGSSKNSFYEELMDYKGRNLLIVTESDQLNIFGQAFRPVFTGTVSEVGFGHLTLDPVIIKMSNAPFYKFPVPLSIPLEKIVHFSPDFDLEKRFPLT